MSLKHGASGYHLGDEEKLLERIIFSNRKILIICFSVITLFLGVQLMNLKPEASFEKMIPLEHPFIQVMLKHRGDLAASENSIQISVEAKRGDIFTKEYMQTLQEVNDTVFYLPGVDRTGLKSIWTPSVRWVEVTEEGFEGGPVIPDGYDGSAESIEQLRQNILKSGQVGRLIADNFKSAIVFVPIFDKNPSNNQPLDYQEFSHLLEEKIREKYQSDDIDIHMIGFSKKVGDLIDGISFVLIFAAIALGITATLLYLYCRCGRGTLAPLFCSVVAVIWQLGLLVSMGYGLDAYSVLVPFLIFAIGVSHGVQVINAVAHEAAKGSGKLESSRVAFRNLYMAGITALISDAVGFLTLLIIDIEVIQNLAVTASIGVAVIILTNLVLLPVIMSYIGVSKSGVDHAQAKKDSRNELWERISQFANPRLACVAIVVALMAAMAGLQLAKGLKIGDLEKGAPELRPDSRYNIDNHFITSNYAVSSDVLVVMTETPPDACAAYETMDAIDRLQWELENTPGVQATQSMVNFSKSVIVGMNEGNMKWYNLSRSQAILNNSLGSLSWGMPDGFINGDCSLAPILVFLDDHKADTLRRVLTKVEAFADANNNENLQFVLGAGNGGIEAATNEVIEQAQKEMLLFVYLVVGLLVFITFRSITKLLCIIIPLALTSVLCQALMAYLGIGVKVATLPVIALGVGIGVDYGIYIYSRLDSYLKQGLGLQEAYLNTLKTTGKAVSFTGITLAIGVATWIWSPIKFQADMGILLTFMFLLNMIGALCLLPALACFTYQLQSLFRKASNAKEIQA